MEKNLKLNSIDGSNSIMCVTGTKNHMKIIVWTLFMRSIVISNQITFLYKRVIKFGIQVKSLELVTECVQTNRLFFRQL